ncbi:MAG: hypothetical protein QOI20_1760 [Acidimicrobiaceae bacterium]|jgi:uncharacterized protein (TIGR03083 family)|nr:hypothetical protein [Acidimicrobiaceae bacterium]
MHALGDVYKAGRERITELVAAAPLDEVRRTVPACPEWTVHDTVAHLSGVCADIVAGNIEGVASDPWTAAQVDRRRSWSLEQVLGEWTELGPQVEAIAEFFPGRTGSQLVLDLTTHEHDVRQALGRPGARDAAGVQIGSRFVAEVGLCTSVAVRGLPPLEVISGDNRWVVGTGRPAAGGDERALAAAAVELAGQVLQGGEPVTADVEPVGSLKIEPFELMRALTGRRSAAQIRAYDWSVDPEPYVPAFQFGPFTTPANDLPE